MKIVALVAGLSAALVAGLANAQTPAPTVKVTPLGSHTGEFCPLDRALVFEDPDGTRILYDAGRTVRGPDDNRLGKATTWVTPSSRRRTPAAAPSLTSRSS
jgi:hypothetical protein